MTVEPTVRFVDEIEAGGDTYRAARISNIPNRYEENAVLGSGAQAMVLELIGAGKRVCELGPATGYMSAAIFAQGNELVAGVEIDPAAAEQAARWFRTLYVRDLDAIHEDARLPIHDVDVLVAADVLEHLKNPDITLDHMRGWMAPNGYIVASIPNVAHGSVRLALLAGTWPVAPVGLLDATHLRFYTGDGIVRLFDRGGWEIDSMYRVTKPIELSEVPWPQDNEDFQNIAAILSTVDDALTYQYIVKARPRQ